jgi:hypothetical protein
LLQVRLADGVTVSALIAQATGAVAAAALAGAVSAMLPVVVERLQPTSRVMPAIQLLMAIPLF